MYIKMEYNTSILQYECTRNITEVSSCVRPHTQYRCILKQIQITICRLHIRRRTSKHLQKEFKEFQNKSASTPCHNNATSDNDFAQSTPYLQYTVNKRLDFMCVCLQRFVCFVFRSIKMAGTVSSREGLTPVASRRYHDYGDGRHVAACLLYTSRCV